MCLFYQQKHTDAAVLWRATYVCVTHYIRDGTQCHVRRRCGAASFVIRYVTPRDLHRPASIFYPLFAITPRLSFRAHTRRYFQRLLPVALYE